MGLDGNGMGICIGEGNGGNTYRALIEHQKPSPQSNNARQAHNRRKTTFTNMTRCDSLPQHHQARSSSSSACSECVIGRASISKYSLEMSTLVSDYLHKHSQSRKWRIDGDIRIGVNEL